MKFNSMLEIYSCHRRILDTGSSGVSLRGVARLFFYTLCKKKYLNGVMVENFTGYQVITSMVTQSNNAYGVLTVYGNKVI